MTANHVTVKAARPVPHITEPAGSLWKAELPTDRTEMDTICTRLSAKGLLPLVPEESVQGGLAPPPCTERSHVHQLREVLPAGSISTEEPGAHLRRPG